MSASTHTVRWIPHSSSMVPASSHNAFAVGREGNRLDPIPMAFKHKGSPTRGRVPDFDDSIQASCGDTLAIWREATDHTSAACPFRVSSSRPKAVSHYFGRLVLTGSGNRTTVRRKSYRRDWSGMSIEG